MKFLFMIFFFSSICLCVDLCMCLFLCVYVRDAYRSILYIVTGKKISTKAVGKSTREDITREYKFAENSALERASVRKAMGKAGNVAVISTPKTLEMKVKPVANAVEIGKDIEVKVHLKNTANKDLSLSISVGGSIVRYNGVCKGEPISMKRKEEISGDSGWLIKIVIFHKKFCQ